MSASPRDRYQDPAYGGLIAAPVVPMLPDGAVDWPSLDRYVEWLAGQAPDGLAVNMAAGEVHALSGAERTRILERYVAIAGGAVKIVAGVAGQSTQDAIAQASRARELGADAIVLFPPLPLFLGRPLPAEMVVEFHRDVAAAVDLPLIAFQLAAGQGPQFSPDAVAGLGDLPQLVAIKNAANDVGRLVELRESVAALDGTVHVLTGGDQSIFEELVLGSSGALIGFASAFTRELVSLQRAVRERDLDAGEAIWERLGPLARYAWRPPLRDYRIRMKEVLVALGLFPRAVVRRPLLPVSESERARLRALTDRARASTSAAVGS